MSHDIILLQVYLDAGRTKPWTGHLFKIVYELKLHKISTCSNTVKIQKHVILCMYISQIVLKKCSAIHVLSNEF